VHATTVGIFEAAAANAIFLIVGVPFTAAVYTAFAAFDAVARFRQWRRGTN
jgi:hypothetical protein